MTGIVISIKPDPEPIVVVNGTSSPNSSDKENSAKKASLTKKQLLYCVKLDGEVATVLEDLSPENLQRTGKFITRDNLRMFIKANAMRHGFGTTASWIVDTSVLRRYKISTKGRAFEIDKDKVVHTSKLLEKEYFKQLKNSKEIDLTIDITQDDLESPRVKKGKMLKKRFSINKKEFSVLKDASAPSAEVAASDIQRMNNGTLADSGGTKKKFKQSSILGFANSSFNQIASPNSPRTPKIRLPTFGTELVALFEKNEIHSKKFNRLKVYCAERLTNDQTELLPAKLKETILERRML
ncbi:Tyrosine-protein kinase baz1b [Cichlidogyrus casuarinus]|uniref:Tyrosine-protein kinase baz1b n=1 Tax=Cichlidogyrus casuarinus TaxID=1844966 RepID=A0ABD2QMB3_9PLAT